MPNERVLSRVCHMKRATLARLLLAAKGSRRESVERATVPVLRLALVTCLRIGRVSL